MSTQTYHMTNRLDAVDPMVVVLRSQVEDALEDNTRFRFEVGITEVLTNLVHHAETDTIRVPVVITLHKKQGHAEIEIFDPIGAKPFDPSDHVNDLSTVDAMAEGGRGIGLIMQCADVVRYGPSGDGHSLYLEFSDVAQPDITSQPVNGESE